MAGTVEAGLMQLIKEVGWGNGLIGSFTPRADSIGCQYRLVAPVASDRIGTAPFPFAVAALRLENELTIAGRDSTLRIGPILRLAGTLFYGGEPPGEVIQYFELGPQPGAPFLQVELFLGTTSVEGGDVEITWNVSNRPELSNLWTVSISASSHPIITELNSVGILTVFANGMAEFG